MNAIYIILDSERKSVMLEAVAKTLAACTDMYTKQPYEQLLKNIKDANQEMVLYSNSGALECLIYSLARMGKDDETSYSAQLSVHLRRAEKQGEMCKKSHHITVILNLKNKISTRTHW